jgi:uncharacterized protein involved in exopolysaccharide biosynthesis
MLKFKNSVKIIALGSRIMQEEISLREIIETIWNGKWIITAITAVAVLVAGIYSFWFVSPVYEATAMVRVESKEELSSTINSIAETIKSDVSVHRVMTKLGVDSIENSVAAVKSRIRVETIRDSKVLKVSMRGTDPINITSFVNLLAFEVGARFEITDRSSEIVDINQRLEEIEDSLEVMNSELDEIRKQLENTSEKLYTAKSVSGESLLQSTIESQFSQSPLEAGTLELIEESINPVYLELKGQLAKASISYSKLLAEKSVLLADLDDHQTRIDELETQILNERLSSRNLEKMLDGLNAVFISPAIEPENPVSPNKKLNLALALVGGLFVGVIAVFVRRYWQISGQRLETDTSSVSV